MSCCCYWSGILRTDEKLYNRSSSHFVSYLQFSRSILLVTCKMWKVVQMSCCLAFSFCAFMLQLLMPVAIKTQMLMMRMQWELQVTPVANFPNNLPESTTTNASKVFFLCLGVKNTANTKTGNPINIPEEYMPKLEQKTEALLRLKLPHFNKNNFFLNSHYSQRQLFLSPKLDKSSLKKTSVQEL